MKVRYSGQWKDAGSYVKHNGIWKPATESLKHNGEWITHYKGSGLYGIMTVGHHYYGGSWPSNEWGYNYLNKYGSLSKNKVPQLNDAIITGFYLSIQRNSSGDINQVRSWIIFDKNISRVSIMIRLNDNEAQAILSGRSVLFYTDVWKLENIKEGTKIKYYIEVLD